MIDAVYCNSQTLNFQRLVYFVCQQLEQLTPDAVGIATANAVYLLRAILKDLIEGLNSAQIMSFVEIPDEVLSGELGEELKNEFSGLADGSGGSLLAMLARVSLSSLAQLPSPPTPGAYLFQMEIIELLIVMASTQLFAPQGLSARNHGSQHFFLEAFIAQPSLAGPAVQAMLQHYITSPAPPYGLTLYAPPHPRGALNSVKSAASSVLWLPYSAYTMLRRTGANGVPGGSPLADASISFLLDLYFYPPANLQTENPFRRVLKTLQDLDYTTSDSGPEAAEGGYAGVPSSLVNTSSTTTAATVSYSALFDTLGKTLLIRETSVLLLYALLHGTPHFNDYCMARSDIDSLLLPILELLYSAKGRTANQLYMLLIVLLILSQDSAFASNIHRVPLRTVPFYKERQLVDTTLGSLLVMLLLRTAHYNLASLKDVYLHTNTLATLANLAPSMTNLSSHTAQRLVHLLQLLHRRYANLLAAEQLAGGGGGGGDRGALSDTTTTAVDVESENLEHRLLELQLYSDFIRIVLEIVNAILVNALPSNPELVYALLHQRDIFLPFANDPQYVDLMENILQVIDHFGRKVEHTVSAVSAENVLAAIKISSRGWRRDKLRIFPELRFSYEEEASPEDFFVPYVWSLLIARTMMAIPWNVAAVTAFALPLPLSSSSSSTTTTSVGAETNTPLQQQSESEGDAAAAPLPPV